MHNPLTQRNLPNVLLIDDDLISREVAATVLTMSGYAVQTAEGGEAALAALHSGGSAPGLILMDAQMPGLSGAELIGQLRALTRAPIVIMSGSAIAGEMESAADGFLLKPFDPAALQQVLAKRPVRVARQRSATGPVVSPQTVAEFRGLMPEAAIREIYAALIADLTHRVGALEAAFAQHDLAEVRRIGHAIKGGCAMAGALEAARLGAQLEALAVDPQGNQLDDSARLLDDLRDAARNLKRMLDAGLPA